jgi:hypothetical protein
VFTRGLFACSCDGEDFESNEARVFHANRNASEFVQFVRSRVPAIVTGPRPLPDGFCLENKSLPKDPKDPPLSEGSTIRILTGPKVPRPRDDIKAAGITFSDYVPSTVPKTQESARLALTQRLLKVVPIPDQQAWEVVVERREDPLSAFYLPPHRPDGKFVVTPDVVRKWIGKYSLTRQEELFNAWLDLSRRPLTVQDMTKRGILKIEKGDPFGGTTPRGVYACSDRALMAHAAVFHLLGAFWRELYSPTALNELDGTITWVDDHPIVWGTGCSGLQLGLWHDAVREYHPDWEVLSYDISKAEASRSEQSMDAWQRITRGCCADEDFRNWNDMRRSMKISFAKERVKAKTKDKMGSGDADTTVSTFADNMGMVCYHFGEPLAQLSADGYSGARTEMCPPPYDLTKEDRRTVTTPGGIVLRLPQKSRVSGIGQWRYAAMGNGDDGNVFGPPILFSAPDWERSTEALGFKTTYQIVPWWKAEFCRNRPWPSSRGTYYSVMIGRVIARLGWHLKDSKDWSPLAVALGLRDHTRHVPFVRKLIDRMIQLTTGPLPKPAPTHDWALRGAGPAEPVPETWDMCLALYGLGEDDEERFAQLLATATSMPIILHWPPLRHCLDVDDS